MEKNTVAARIAIFESGTKTRKEELNPRVPVSPNKNNANNNKEDIEKKNRTSNGPCKVRANNQCNDSEAPTDLPAKLPPKDVDIHSRHTTKKVTEDIGTAALEGFQVIDEEVPDEPRILTAQEALSGSEMARTLVALDDAIELCAKTKSEDSELLVQRGLLKFQQHSYKEALEDFNSALLSRPNAVTLQYRGMTKHRQGELDRALDDFNQANELQPNNWLTLFMRGQVQTERGAFLQAIDDFNRAEREQPDNKDIRKARAIARGKIGDKSGSLTDSDDNDAKPAGYWASVVNAVTSTIYRKSIALKEKRSKIVENHYSQALSKLRQEKYQEAIDELTYAIELDKANAVLLRTRGEIYRLTRKFEEALKDLNAAEKLQPNDAITIASRALLYYEDNQMLNAYSDFCFFDKLSPGNTEYTDEKLKVQNWVLSEIPNGEIFNTGRMLGSGSFACVFEATWKEKNEPVARKLFNNPRILENTSEEAILNEVKIIMGCQHKNIVASYGLYIDGGVSLIMECSTEGSLQKMLSENVRLSPEQILGFARDIAAGLVYIHTRHIIHRDLKPANILLFNGRTTAKIADFGQSRILEAAIGEAKTVTGTLGYMAPEILEEKGYEKPVDIFSFGVLLYELCTGNTLPNFGNKENERSQRINTTVLAPYEMFRQLIRRCCKIDPKERPTSQDIVTYLDDMNLARVTFSDRVLKIVWRWSVKK